MALPLDAHTRKVFYSGGEYETDVHGKQSLRGQIYVEHLTPASPERDLSETPIVLIPGGGRTGDFLTTADGKPGWASVFLSRGFEVYIIDQAFRGRSPWHGDEGMFADFSADLAEKIWTRPAAGVPLPWPNASLHTQWPGSGARGDAAFDAMFASMSPSLNDYRRQEIATSKSCAALLDRIGKPVILLGHSFGAMIVWLVADARPTLVKGAIAVEPAGPPFIGMGVVGPRTVPTDYGLTYSSLTYDPPVKDPERDFVTATVKAPVDGWYNAVLQADDPPPKKLVNLLHLPIAVITGEASKHALYDWAIVEFLRQAGVNRAEHILLGDRGIHGNGHMLLMEKNSSEIADMILDWIGRL